MKVIGYAQVVPKYNPQGGLVGASLKSIHPKFPRTVLEGAFVLRLNVTLPDNAFRPVVCNVEVPLDCLAHQARVEVEVPPDTFKE